LIYNDKDEPIFDSEAEGIEIDGVYTGPGSDNELKTGKFFEMDDRDQNGRPEIYFEEHGYASDPPRRLIIEETEGIYKVLFYDFLKDIAYRDFNNDGKPELFGYTRLGQIPLNPLVMTIMWQNLKNTCQGSTTGWKACRPMGISTYNRARDLSPCLILSTPEIIIR